MFLTSGGYAENLLNHGRKKHETFAEHHPTEPQDVMKGSPVLYPVELGWYLVGLLQVEYNLLLWGIYLLFVNNIPHGTWSKLGKLDMFSHFHLLRGIIWGDVYSKKCGYFSIYFFRPWKKDWPGHNTIFIAQYPPVNVYKQLLIFTTFNGHFSYVSSHFS